jgi:hypothetical protein
MLAANNLSDLTSVSVARANLGVATGSDVQPFDANLSALAGINLAADFIPYSNGPESLVVTPFTAAARDLVGDATVADMRTTLGVEIGTDVQGYSPTLNEFAGLTILTNNIPYSDSPGSLAMTPFSPAARFLVDDFTYEDMRTTLGVGIGTDVQAFDGNLNELADLSMVADTVLYSDATDSLALTAFTATARELLDDDTVEDMQATLGVAVGSEVQAFDINLSSLAALSLVADQVIYSDGVDSLALTTFTAVGRDLMDDDTVVDQRVTLGLGSAATSALTISASSPSGGDDGDLWAQVAS